MSKENVYISDLPISYAFRQACAEHGLITLRELLAIPVNELSGMSWLTDEMLDELKRYVEVEDGDPGK